MGWVVADPRETFPLTRYWAEFGRSRSNHIDIGRFNSKVHNAYVHTLR